MWPASSLNIASPFPYSPTSCTLVLLKKKKYYKKGRGTGPYHFCKNLNGEQCESNTGGMASNASTMMSNKMLGWKLFPSRGEIYIRLMFLDLGGAEIYFPIMFLVLCAGAGKRELDEKVS